MEKIIITLNKQIYPIVIEHALTNELFSFCSLRSGDQVLIITNSCIAPMYLKGLCNLFMELEVLADQLILSDGEQTKSLDTLDIILTKLLSKYYDRNVILVALGGGVIGDITGFAASVYQRGIRFMQVPTTLLAQVDASIGGKTGINHVLGKNMIGSFHHPISVIINVKYLDTLTIREFSSGLAEIIKYAVAFDSVFFNWLEDNLDNLFDIHHRALLMECIVRCCKLKARVVMEDECDQGIRNILNFGHTYGHAIESYLGYSQWSHGEAISAGIMLSVSTALELGEFNYIDANRIKSILIRANLPICGPLEMHPEDYLRYMKRDKKSTLGQFNLILPISIGNAKAFFNIPSIVIINSIQSIYS